MYPFIFHHGDFFIPTFFFMVMVASLTTTFYCYWQAKKKGMSQVAILDISLLGTLCGVMGARLFHIFFEAPWYYWEHPSYVFHFWQGGFVGYGVFIGITVSTLCYLKLKKLPVLDYADLIALGCPLIILLVRVGCLGAGCCYGKPTDFFLHLTFNNPASDAGHDFRGVALHATQIYDMLNAMFTFVVIHIVDRYRKFRGQVMIVFFLSYAFFRFCIEYLRGDEDRGVYLDGWLSTSQITGIVIWVVGGLLYWQLSKKRIPQQKM